MKESKKIEEVLAENGFVLVPIHGTSMRPLLKEAKSIVQIEQKDGRYERGDVVLFRKEDGTLVLHRIIEAQGNEYVVLGDHQYKEKEKIHLSQIIGCVSEYWTSGKQIHENSFGYRIYYAIWNGNLMIRRIVLALLRLSGND